jgi:hypothetical protein
MRACVIIDEGDSRIKSNCIAAFFVAANLRTGGESLEGGHFRQLQQGD